MIYFIFFSMIALATVLNLFFRFKGKDTAEIIIFVCIAIALYAMAAFRECGFDYFNYMHIYQKISYLEFSAFDISEFINIEPIYIIINKVMPSYEVLVAFIAGISIIPKIYYFWNFSNNKFVCMLLYFSGSFIMYDMGVIREGLAMMFCLYSTIYIEKHDLKKFLLLVIVAAGFHISALFFLPAYAISTRNLSRKVYYGGAIAALIFTEVFTLDMLNFVVSKLPFDGMVAFKFSYYTNGYDAGISNFISLLKRIAILVVFVEYSIRKNAIGKYDNIYLNCYYLSVIGMAIFSSIPIIGGRGMAPLYIMQTPLLASIIHFEKKSIMNRLVLTILIICLAFNSMYVTLHYDSSYVPYVSIF